MDLVLGCFLFTPTKISESERPSSMQSNCFLTHSFPPEDIQDFALHQPRETQGAFPVEENTQWVSRAHCRIETES